MVSALAPKPRLAPNLVLPRAPLGKSPLRLVPTLPEAPPPTPRMGFGGAAGSALFTISALWSAKTAYDAVKAVPSQLPWMPGKPVDPSIWSDPERVQLEAHARFGSMDTGHLNTLKFVREKQAMPMQRDPMQDPHDRNLFVQNEEGEWVQIPLAGQQSGALEIGTLWEHGLPGKPMHERAADELRLIEIELGRRNFKIEETKADADNSWFEQYTKYIQELAEAMRKRANGENVPLPIFVINTPKESTMTPQTKPQLMCSAASSEGAAVTPSASGTKDATSADQPLSSDDLEGVDKRALPLSGVSFGQALDFHGIAQRQHFPAYVAPDYVEVLAQAAKVHPYQTVVFAYDKAVPNIEAFVDKLASHVNVPVVRVPLDAGEQLKTIEQVGQVTRSLEDQEIGAKSLMLVVGGGTLCNAVGFIATMWSGMESIVIPTNFTAIGDVAIGSLHMVNVGASKNRLQLYYDPLAVVLDPHFISTLPQSERRNGLAETAKHAFAQDAKLFEAMESAIADGTIFNDDILFDFALRTAQLKDELMGVDPFGEPTQHVFLYGHVIAHAIEPATNYTMSHGEAVSLGLLAELAFFNAPTSEIFLRAKAMLGHLGLPTVMPSNLSKDAVMHHLSHMMTPRGTLLIPRVTKYGNLEKVDGHLTGEFDRAAILKALESISR